MKRLHIILLLATVVVALVGCSQNPPLPAEDTLADRDFVGYQVLDEAGTRFGQVQSVVVDIETGTIEYVILSVARGAFVNPRGTPPQRPTPFIALPWEVLELDIDQRALILQASDEALLNAPRLEALPNTNLRDWDAEIRTYWESQ